MTPPAPRSPLWARFGVFLLLAGLVAPLICGLAMTKGLSHDEHQHVAAGALLAREGLLPYRDFPHFHTPYLAFTYGVIFKFTDHLLLGARLFSAACAIGIVALVGATVHGLFAEKSRRTAWLAALGAIGFMLSATVFTHTTGRAWNQEPALLLAVGAFLLHAAGVERASRGWLLGSGILLGLAIGFRITYAPLVAPFALSLWLAPAPAGRVNLLAWFAGGLALGLSGLAWLAAIAPEQAWFGNFEFSQVNVVYRFATGEPRTMTLLKKLRFAFKEIIRPDAGLMLAFVIALSAAMARRGSAALRFSLPWRFLLLLLPFVLIGALAPSPVFEQYFYPFTAFLVLGTFYAFALIPTTSIWMHRTAWGLGAAAMLSVVIGARGYAPFRELLTPRKWTPIEIHAEGLSLRQQVPAGKVLSLAPIATLEGGLSIYPAFATGPFAWRIAPFVEPAKAVRVRMIQPATLETILAADPPAAILAGFERRHETELVAFARQHRFRSAQIAGGKALWVKSLGSSIPAP